MPATREATLEYQRQWRRKNKELIKRLNAAYYAKNAAKYSVWNKNWSETHKEHKAAYAKVWNAANKERKAALHRAWRARNKGRLKARRLANRVREALRAYGLRGDDRKAFMAAYEMGCVYCGLIGFLEVDHKVPRSQGGGHERTNLQWLCRRCNRSKHDMTDEEFFTHLRKLLAIRQQFEDCAALAYK